MNKLFNDIWGEAVAFLTRPRKFNWIDVTLVIGLGGLLFGIVGLAREWTGAHRQVFEIDLSPKALPRYTFFSLCRGLIAYLFSLGFTLVYGYWAAKDKIAERVLVPLLDILQSIPVLGFMPGFVLALVALFPSSNIGLELSCVLMIFTGQVWNMTFSYYHSLRSVPQDLQEVSRVYGFNWWQRLKGVELPYATIGLVWNSMMSMAGGWFFLMITEAFVLGDNDFRLPGLGSYMSVAVQKGNAPAMLWAIAAMVILIVILDQILWRPIVVWAQKFRVEESGRQEIMSSWFLNWLRKSGIGQLLISVLGRNRPKAISNVSIIPIEKRLVSKSNTQATVISITAFVALLGLLTIGALKLVHILSDISISKWLAIFSAAFLTMGRVMLATALGTIWTLPAGLAIGLSPRLSRLFQPVVQVVASFPAPMLFPAVIAGLYLFNISLGWGSVMLMLLGTQWYVLFNVIAGAMAIPADLREAAKSYHLSKWQRFACVYVPAVFPYLITGWVTAAGGAWNASIVAEYVTFRGQTLSAWGLGSQISQAAQGANYPVLAASVLVMSALVVTFNRLVWKSMYHWAEQQFSLNK